MSVFHHILKNCIQQERKNVLVIYDNTTSKFLNDIYVAGESIGKIVKSEKIKELACHGEEPPSDVKRKMHESDVVICLTHYSLAHTMARRELSNSGIPFLSMPDYNSDMINNPALLTNYLDELPLVRKYTDKLSKGNVIKIKTDLGTDLRLDIAGRMGNCCPGLVNDEFLLGSPPDIEANIAPIEANSNGTLIIDGSITDYRIGLLKHPVKLTVLNGKIQSFETDDKNTLKIVEEIFKETNSEKAYYIGEFGIGFNQDAKICGNMLIDEGARGCVHFGMGSNWTIGGNNNVPFHLDFVLKNATVFVDDEKIIDRGQLIYE